MTEGVQKAEDNNWTSIGVKNDTKQALKNAKDYLVKEGEISSDLNMNEFILKLVEIGTDGNYPKKE